MYVPRFLSSLHAESNWAVASLVHVAGSSYLPSGALMAFHPDGRSLGVISGGCLEADLRARVESDGVRDTAQLLVYDLRRTDDLGFGPGAGCDGVLTVLLEPWTDDLAHMFERILAAWALQSADAGWPSPSSIPLARVRRVWHQGLGCVTVMCDVGGHLVARYSVSAKPVVGVPAETEWDVYYEPRPRLVIFGAGPDVPPIVSLAHRAGFDVVLWDWREELLRRARFPHAKLLLTGTEEAVAAARVSSYDHVLVITHQYERDLAILRHLARVSPFYTGLLASRKRAARMLSDLPDGHRVHAPVGLPIGAEGPDEIAVSIVAELIHTQSGRRQTHARGVLMDTAEAGWK